MGIEFKELEEMIKYLAEINKDEITAELNFIKINKYSTLNKYNGDHIHYLSLSFNEILINKELHLKKDEFLSLIKSKTNFIFLNNDIFDKSQNTKIKVIATNLNINNNNKSNNDSLNPISELICVKFIKYIFRFY